MADKKFNFVYLTTNMANGKKYIGKHSTNDLNDGYIGSGTILKRAIKKHGFEQFSFQILKMFDTSQEALDYEAELVTTEIVESSEYYNMKIGGQGGGIVFTDDIKARMVESRRKFYSENPGTTLGKIAFTNGVSNIFIHPDQNPPTGYYKGLTTSHPGPPKGVKPSVATTAGTYWSNNGSINKLVKAGGDLLPGFTKGRLMKRDGIGRFKGTK